MNLKEIKELIEMIRGTEISEIELERDGSRVRIRLGELPPVYPVTGPTAAVSMAHTPEIEPATVPQGEATAAEGPELAPGQILITSPMVGTFYRSPTPGESPFVEIGGAVEKGQPLCIIEAMKLMNEIEAEREGRVLKILKQDKDPVEYGEPLFVLEPLS